MIMDFVVIVANFAYAFYVCGKNRIGGCSGEIVHEDEIIEVKEDGKLLCEFCLFVLVYEKRFSECE